MDFLVNAAQIVADLMPCFSLLLHYIPGIGSKVTSHLKSQFLVGAV